VRLNHADVTVRLPHAVSSGKCGLRSGLLDQKEISRFMRIAPNWRGFVRAICAAAKFRSLKRSVRDYDHIGSGSDARSLTG
jgi:hypothetical protein